MSAGYGMFSASKLGIKCRLAHRWSYECFVGPIHEGGVIDHVCNDKLCVNPRHLRVTTHKVNIARGRAPSAVMARRTECEYGHRLTAENRLRRTNGCKKCKNRRDREDYSRHTEDRRTSNREKMRRWRAAQRARA